MMFQAKSFVSAALVAVFFMVTGTNALVPPSPFKSTPAPTQQQQQQPILKAIKNNNWGQQLTAAAVVLAANIPSQVLAAATDAIEDDYEYGAVDAPIGIAVAGGVLAILTAAVPILLKPGEEALDQMRADETSKGLTFGKGDALDNKKKK
eukprot:CAMPEP_0198146502 /NCGR_PEP_ID=MMETSP1443-20131203/29617_1 /TAXON_ID=186043 /ORGANISM="Entomoneis sp., Strain CCMP2396" /LENGTH=149 /DNA_ID=CAMNT_0043810489 /DNA_START=88 /DNA_END=537 /DNA_ORIENTATION=-